MSGMLRRGMSWLGLGPEEDYDDYDYADEAYFDDEPLEPEREPAVRDHSRPPRRRPQPVDEWDDPGEAGGIRVLPSEPGGRAEVTSEPPRVRSVVRPLPSAPAKPHVVTPESFNDAQEVGDWFKKRQPVILNLQGLDRDLARRLLDFASGVAYGLGGSVERVASHVYLLTPADVEVSQDERRRIKEGVLVDEAR